MDNTVSDERDQAQEMSHVKQVLNMYVFPDWLINSIPTIKPSLQRKTSVSSDDTSDDVEETETIQQARNPPVKNPQQYCLIHQRSVRTVQESVQTI